MLLSPLGACWPGPSGYRALGWCKAQNKESSVITWAPCFQNGTSKCLSSSHCLVFSLPLGGLSLPEHSPSAPGLGYLPPPLTKTNSSSIVCQHPALWEMAKNLSLCYILTFCYLRPKGQRVSWFLPGGWHIRYWFSVKSGVVSWGQGMW